MTTTLGHKESEFVRRMASSDEKAAWGFEILIEKRAGDLESFFDLLEGYGLFSPEKNSGPVPAKQEGLFHIPYWPALNYLRLLAKRAGEREDDSLANRIIEVVRNVSAYRDDNGDSIDNYHTFRTFAEIYGFLPLSVITRDDVSLISHWLESKYDTSGVFVELISGFLPRLLESGSDESDVKAVIVLDCVTALKEVDKIESDSLRRVTVVGDSYWLSELLKKHANAFGSKLGKDASKILVGRLNEVFLPGKAGYLVRPAIEPHEQNLSRNEDENIFIDGLRDVVSSWVDIDVEAAKPCLRKMISSNNEYVQRIAIYMVNRNWNSLSDLYVESLSTEFFHPQNWHELYELLRDHFGEFSEELRARTVNVIRELPLPIKGDYREIRLRGIQRDWLSAVYGKGSEEADRWFEELESDDRIGDLSDHPNFLSYFSTLSGPGPTPHTKEELLAYLFEGILIEKLNSFVERDSWFGPTKHSLSSTLIGAVEDNPNSFFSNISLFLRASRTYQYSILKAFLNVWEMQGKTENRASINWDDAWENLIEFVEAIVGSNSFWEEEVVDERGLSPNRNWIPPVVAEIIRAGTQKDEWAYSPSLLPKTRYVLGVLLDRLLPEEDPGDDPMHMAINSSRGKCIEAFFDHSLRECRVADRSKSQHIDEWNTLRPTFDKEVESASDRNFEFSTLAGAYIANLMYLDSDWVNERLDYIFSKTSLNNFKCAINGLSYAAANRVVYKLLRDEGVIDRALSQQKIGRQDRERLLERIALAYLWGEETLEGERFSYLYSGKRFEDITAICNFLWSIRNKEMSSKQRSLVLDFFHRTLDWGLSFESKPYKMLSSLSKLVCYISDLDDRYVELVTSVASFAGEGFESELFLEELLRFVETDVRRANAIVKEFLSTYQTTYDYQDKLKSLIIKIAEAGGEERIDANSYANWFHHLKGMEKVYSELQMLN